MNEKMKSQLEQTIIACAAKVQESKTALDAQQYAQAALNAANALIGMSLNMKN